MITRSRPIRTQQHPGLVDVCASFEILLVLCVWDHHGMVNMIILNYIKVILLASFHINSCFSSHTCKSFGRTIRPRTFIYRSEYSKCRDDVLCSSHLFVSGEHSMFSVCLQIHIWLKSSGTRQRAKHNLFCQIRQTHDWNKHTYPLKYIYIYI